MNMFNDVYFTPILVNDLTDMILSLVNINATGILGPLNKNTESIPIINAVI